MTLDITQSDARVVYAPTTPTTAFAVPFEFYADEDLAVYVDGVLKTLATDYSVSGAGVQGGGTVTLVAAVDDVEVIIIRDAAVKRTTHFPSAGPFDIATLNRQLNEITIWCQQLRTKLNRAVRLADDDATAELLVPDKATRAGKYAKFDGNGDFSAESVVTPGALSVSAFIETLLDDADAATARATLGVTGANDASETVKGIVELATIAETQAGTDAVRAITPDGLAALWEKGADIASAATLTLPATGGGYHDVTGTTTVTAISAAAAGYMVEFRFAGTLTLTHNATSLILPGGANITTAAGDAARFRSLGGGNWRCVGYTRADGKALIGAATGLQKQVFTASGTFTVPAGVTAVKVTAVGGGGGGGNGNFIVTSPGAGGGAGGCAIKWPTGLTPGANITITIGAGGAAGVAGGTSSFGAYCSATGGAAGTTQAIAGTGGAGGTGSSGDINLTGGKGGTVFLATVGTDGGSSLMGAGGRGGVDNNAGAAGLAYGGGGGGGGQDGAASSAGGAGAGGIIIIEWLA